ncbi:MAG: LLM class flavin-dependent oxidoreductase, partial [Alphaproteobacteria bacterium]|nr:LLM class flavin-dependent oxidoreductase [Alphaproteobacteria bacterium]
MQRTCRSVDRFCKVASAGDRPAVLVQGMRAMMTAAKMDGRPDISLRLDGSMRPAHCVALAKVADDVGLTGIWFAENAFARGILPTAAVCAAATIRLQINAGVFNPFSRHPTMMAMEIGSLDEISQGRASLSIGAGIIEAVAKIGFAADKPLPALRDTLAIVRGLLRGETVDHAGPSLCAREVRLGFAPRAGIPIFLAGRGDLTVKLAGEAADGLIISNMCSLEFARRVAERVHASHRAAGRTDSVKVIRYMPCAVAENRADAVNDAKSAIAKMF